MTPAQRSGRNVIPAFVLRGREHAWIIAAGAVDLYLVEVHDGTPRGARRHLRRASAGEVLLGMDVDGDVGAGILASPLPGTELTPVESRSVETDLLDQWIGALSEKAVNEASPRFAVALRSGNDVRGLDQAAVLQPRNGVCWVRSQAGEPAYLGDPKLAALDGGTWFPIAAPAWLLAGVDSVITVVDSTQWREHDREASGLDAFHRAVLNALVIERDRQDRSERERILASAANEDANVSASLRRLGTPLGAVVDTGDLALDSEPLLRACAAVGRAAGITIRPSRGRSTTDTIQAVARASGIRARRVALRGEWWRQDGGAMVAFREGDQRPVALLVRGGRYQLWDPVDNRTLRLNGRRALELDSFAWSLYRPFPERPLSPLDLLRFGLRGGSREIAAIALMGAVGGLLATLTPIATGVLFDRVIPGADRGGVVALSAILTVCAISSALLSLASRFAVLRLEGRMESVVQAALWDRLLGLPVPFFRDYTAGDLAQRSLGVSQIRRILTSATITSIISGIFSVFSLGLMFAYSLSLGLIGAALSLIAVAVTTAVGLAQLRRHRELTTIQGRISGMVLQFIGGIAKLRVSGKERRAFAAWARVFATQKQQAAEVRRLSNLLLTFNSTFPVVCTAVIFYANLADRTTPLLATGQFVAFHAALFQFLRAALELSSTFVSILAVVPLFERARPILESVREVDSSKSEPGDLRGHIEVSHVFFRYRSDAPLVLRDISISIEPGQFVVVVGASGCGKSTLFRLLLGFEKPESGSIYFDGQDLAGLNTQTLRHQIGVVLQNGQLMTGTIYENIVGTLPLTVNDAWEAARLAGFDNDVREMPMGMYTMISEGGGGLSGGQRQRLMIARAIVSKPRIVLFDEATSALDNQTQAVVRRSLEGMQATRVVIAHRLSTVVHADRIFVIDGGRVAEAGTYEELLKREGLFARLAQRQLT